MRINAINNATYYTGKLQMGSLQKSAESDKNPHELIEQHMHGAFGVNFSTCNEDDILTVARKLKTYGIGGFFPTLVTDTPENIKRQIEIIKNASKKQTDDMAKIYGVHLEGIFLNSDKKGIHNSDLFMPATVENYKKIEDDFIKIVTLAPESDKSGELRKYLTEKGVKVQAGHCESGDLSYCSGVTHMFNAMSGVHHRNGSTSLSALVNDDIYTEVIADGVHVSDEALKLLFKCKPINRIIPVSDCLPCTKSDLSEFDFAGEKIYYDGNKATSKDGTLAGSTKLLPEIYEHLKELGLYDDQLIENSYEYHGL